MTREEIENSRAYQTTDAAFEYCCKNHPHYNGDMLGEIIDTFEAGVEWADTTMIDKACKIYREHIIMFNPRLREFPTALDEAVNTFRKRLEK